MGGTSRRRSGLCLCGIGRLPADEPAPEPQAAAEPAAGEPVANGDAERPADEPDVAPLPQPDEKTPAEDLPSAEPAPAKQPEPAKPALRPAEPEPPAAVEHPAAGGAKESRPAGRLIRVPLPITGSVDSQVKRAVERALAELPRAGGRPVLVFEFYPAQTSSARGAISAGP